MSHPNDDDPRDAHLVAALRHAPDRDVTPPPEVTAAILDQARRALHAQRGSAPGGWRAAWDRLWQPAPMTAFGTLVLATLIGVMWGGREVPEATPSLRPESVAAAPAPSRDAPRDASAASVPAAAAPSVERATAPRKPVVRAEPWVARVPSAPKQEHPSTRPGRSETQARPEQETRDAAAAGKLAQPSAIAPPQQNTPQEPSSLPPAAAVAREQAPRMPREPEARRDTVAKSMADAAPASARLRSELAARPLGAAASAARSPLAQANAEIDSAMGSDSARVRWRVAPQRLVAHDAAQRDWWAALARATQGRWQLAATDPASGAELAPLALLIDGAARGRLGFEPQAVVWRDANGTAWRAPIAAETLRAWQQAMARW